MIAVALLGAIDVADSSATTWSPAVSGAPAPPVITAVAHSGGAKVSWTLPANRGSAITKYVVTTYLGTTVQSTQTITCTQPCAPARTTSVSGLTNGKMYRFQVTAGNAKGVSPPAETTIKVSATGIKPGRPGKPKAKAGVGRATLTWNKPSDGSATITGYVVTPFRTGVAQSAVNVKRTKTTMITGLDVGQSYTFRIAAKNVVGKGLQSDASATVVPSAPPGSMEALGDSISAGFSACGSFSPCLSASWSTGTTVNSHYERIHAIDPAIGAHVFNVAQAGAPVSSLAGQVNNAISNNVDYVTVLIGGNDVCNTDESQMTPVGQFQTTFHSAMQSLTSGLPDAKILVVSIPDLYRTWEIGHGNPAAVSAWGAYHFCESMFANPTSTDSADAGRRTRVRQRIVDDNTVLREECLSFANCKWDGNALFSHQWKPSEISTVDYIHPSAAGQQVIADVTDAHGYNW